MDNDMPAACRGIQKALEKIRQKFTLHFCTMDPAGLATGRRRGDGCIAFLF